MEASYPIRLRPVAEDLMPKRLITRYEPRRWMVFGQSVMPVQCCAEAWRQQQVLASLLMDVICCHLLLIVFKKSFYKQVPKCVEATGGISVARRPRALPTQYSGPHHAKFVPSCLSQAQGGTFRGSCNPEGTTSYCAHFMDAKCGAGICDAR